MRNLHKLNWSEMNIEKVISGKTADNTSYLELFLQDYSREFNNTTLNASCKSCLKDYLRKYKLKYNKMENNSNYVLHEKRQGIPLGFGSSVFVTNNNITDAYAKKLVKKYKKVQGDEFKMSFLFSKYPIQEVKKKIVIDSLDIDVSKKVTGTSKNKRTRKARK